jgi:RNA polymerase-binding transcription factor DksA
MLDEAKKQELKQRLLDEKARLERQIARENQEIVDMSSDQANENTYSNHMADDGGFLADIDRTTTIRENFQATLTQVNAALERFDNGTYGISEVSGKPIPAERLEVLPWATRLVGE